MEKAAPVDHEVHELIRRRYSPRAFDPRPITPAVLRSLFEAARWSASSMNEQPWRFIVARRDDAPSFQALLSTLSEKNQRWAHNAGALVLVAASVRHQKNGEPNPLAHHDVGLATAQLVVEATHRDLFVHMMAGFDSARACELLSIPEHFEAIEVLAVGYVADPSTLPDDLRARELAPRTRNPQSSFVFEGQWGQSFES